MSDNNTLPMALAPSPKPTHYPHLHVLMPDDVRVQFEAWITERTATLYSEVKYFKTPRLWMRCEIIDAENPNPSISFDYAVLRPNGTIRTELEVSYFFLEDFLHDLLCELSFVGSFLRADDDTEAQNPTLTDEQVGYSFYRFLIDDGVAEEFFSE